MWRVLVLALVAPRAARALSASHAWQHRRWAALSRDPTGATLRLLTRDEERQLGEQVGSPRTPDNRT